MRHIFEDAFNLLCGKELGRGCSRHVFDCKILPGYVVKVEKEKTVYQNYMEYHVWESVKNSSASRWFAECKFLSNDHRILIQEKTRVPSPAELLDKVPIWFEDIKVENWGMVGTKGDKEYLVCHDYGYHNMIKYGMLTKKLKFSGFKEGL